VARRFDFMSINLQRQTTPRCSEFIGTAAVRLQRIFPFDLVAELGVSEAALVGLKRI
jgi:hypothetical protein